MEASTNVAKAFTPPLLQAHLDGVVKKHKLEKKVKPIGAGKVTELGLSWRQGGESKAQRIVPPLTADGVTMALLANGVSRIDPFYKVRLADGEEVTLFPNQTRKEHGDAPALREGDMVTIHGHVTDAGKPVFTYKVGS